MTTTKLDIDKQLIQKCIQKDRSSLESFYKKIVPMLWPIAQRYSNDLQNAEIVINNTMLKIFNHLHEVDRDNILPWAKKILINTALDEIRKNKKATQYEEITESIEYHVFETEEFVLDGNIENALLELTEIQRSVLKLFYLEEYSHDEIAAILQINANNSRWHLHQAKNRMKFLLTNYEIQK